MTAITPALAAPTLCTDVVHRRPRKTPVACGAHLLVFFFRPQNPKIECSQELTARLAEPEAPGTTAHRTPDSRRCVFCIGHVSPCGLPAALRERLALRRSSVRGQAGAGSFGKHVSSGLHAHQGNATCEAAKAEARRRGWGAGGGCAAGWAGWCLSSRVPRAPREPTCYMHTANV